MSVLRLEGTLSSDLHETHWKFASACVKEDRNDVFDQVDRDLHVSGHSRSGDEVASMFREERRRFRECVDSWQADFLEQLQIHTRIIQEASAHMTYGRSEVHPYDRLRQSLVEDDHLVQPSSGSSSCVEELLSEELHAAEHFTFSSSLSTATVDSLDKPSETTSVDGGQAGTGCDDCGNRDRCFHAATDDCTSTAPIRPSIQFRLVFLPPPPPSPMPTVSLMGGRRDV